MTNEPYGEDHDAPGARFSVDGTPGPPGSYSPAYVYSTSLGNAAWSAAVVPVVQMVPAVLLALPPGASLARTSPPREAAVG